MANKALLKHYKSRKPNLLADLTSPNLSQVLHEIPLLALFEHHQKLDKVVAISLHNLLDKKKILIIEVGIACTIAFIKTSLPNFDRNLFFRSVIFDSILSFKLAKV